MLKAFLNESDISKVVSNPLVGFSKAIPSSSRTSLDVQNLFNFVDIDDQPILSLELSDLHETY